MILPHPDTPLRRRATCLAVAAALAALLVPTLPAPGADAAATRRVQRHRSPPNVVLISIDTLRADRLSGYGYGRPTSPAIDRLLAGGVRFDEARTVEPLTNPACSSMLTSLYPHEHGATRNGLRLRPRLASLPRELDRRGYLTAAFVGNWTLRHKISGLAEHFDVFEELFTRKRWMGLFASEAGAPELTSAAITWLDGHAGRRRPIFLWIHYVEPHAPYELHDKVARRLGVDGRRASKADRYDTEIGYVDGFVGRLLHRIDSDRRLAGNTLVVFTSDHGESLGEHGYWGHGRNVYDPGLRIPLALYWPGRLAPRRIAAAATNLDLPPTVLGLLGHPVPEVFQGFDWSPVLTGDGDPDADRLTVYQAHKGAVLALQEAGPARRDGLLEVAVLRGTVKEIARVHQREHRIFDLDDDPRELRDLNGAGYHPSRLLASALEEVEEGLEAADDAPPVVLDDEDVEQLRSLGYLD